ncbi:MAG: ATP-binding protein [Hyphomicrobiaceae bacterium]|nr:ATP-binding protein [Hyphomicrobiaceae bacterium]
MKTLLSWSTGKDSAWALHRLRREGVEVAGLFTTVNSAVDRVAMHAVRRQLLAAQAAAAGLPLTEIPIPYPCSNADYERIMAAFVDEAVAGGVTHMAFGDLFLRDIRSYREARLAGTGIAPLFPVWGLPTDRLAQDMLAAGLAARITCLDPAKVPDRFAGAEFADLLAAALPGVDPCGENGEFHTFCTAGPMFSHPLSVASGATVARDGFLFSDLVLAEPGPSR